VVVQPGVYVPHGQVVVDGIAEAGSEVARNGSPIDTAAYPTKR
jgi:hypothetical protein